MLSSPTPSSTLAEESEQRLVLYSPLPENDTAEKLARLMQGRPQLAPPAVDVPRPAVLVAAE